MSIRNLPEASIFCPQKLPAALATILEIPNRHRMSLSSKHCSPPSDSRKTTAVQICDNSEEGIYMNMSGCASPLVQQYHEKSTMKSGPHLSLQPLHHQHQHQHQHKHQHQHSVSTSTTSSANTSPTTTVSTLESAMTDNTPDSSPESPPSLITTFKTCPPDNANNEGSPTSRPASSGRPNSPSKRARNTKNLSLNVPPPGITSIGPSPRLASGDESRISTPKSVSAPSSPAFIVPPPPANPRRRPSHLGLTIKLPSTLPDKMAPRTGVLRHHQSSPSLMSPSLAGPNGGMTLPGPPQSASYRQTTFQRPTFSMRWANSDKLPEDNVGRKDSTSTTATSMSPETLTEINEEDDIDSNVKNVDEDEDDFHEPRSGEPKSPAYPNGPLCIFDPNIYLFSEPDAALAAQFDVVINVAREVSNPFSSPSPPSDDTDTLFSPIDAPASTPPKLPEYIHLPWDHNTLILPALPTLTTLLSARSSAGKRILVHCQCGVSRSATLLIAYAMYRDPRKTMQEAYAEVKRRSRWIGPNMGLIYQLTDWKKQLEAGAGGSGMGMGGRGRTVSAAGGLGRGGGLRRGEGNADVDAEEFEEPRTAPLPSVGGFPEEMADTGEGRGMGGLHRARSDAGGYTGSGSVLVAAAAIPPPPPLPSAAEKVSSLPEQRLSWPDAARRLRTMNRVSWVEGPEILSPPPVVSDASDSLAAPTTTTIPDCPPPPSPPSARAPHSTPAKIEHNSDSDTLDLASPLTSPLTSPRASTIPAVSPPLFSPTSVTATSSRRSGGWNWWMDPRSPQEGGPGGVMDAWRARGWRGWRNIGDVL